MVRHSIVTGYDALYRFVQGLDHPRTEVGSALRIVVRRCLTTHRLPSGTVVPRGAHVGILHVDNAHVIVLHARGLTPIQVGLAFRRQMITSLATLAALSRPGARFDGVEAFTAVTIFHTGLERLGFEVEADGLAWPQLVASYQRTLLRAIHPGGTRLGKRTRARAERLWITRQRLVELYGNGRLTRASPGTARWSLGAVGSTGSPMTACCPGHRWRA
jgi:hypothetical protein